MFDYVQLEGLVEVVEQGSFGKAASRLSITQSALSQKIKKLEEQLGLPLLVRSSPVLPTHAGERLIAHFKKVKLLETTVFSENELLKSKSEFVRVPIAVNTESLSTWLIHAIVPILKSERILLEISLDDQARTLNLLRSGKVLACISDNKTAPNGCESFALGKMQYLWVATEKYAKHYFHEGVSQQSIRRAPTAIYGSSDKIHDTFLASHFSDIADVPYHWVPSPEAMLTLTKKSVCNSLLPAILVERDIASGALVNLAPGKNLELPLFWHVWSHKNPHLQLLTQAIRDESKTLF